MAGTPNRPDGRAALARAALALVALCSPTFAHAAPASPPSPPATTPSPGAVDQELTRPLVPLDQFQLQARQPSGPAPKTPAEVRYTVRVEGLKAVGLEGRFRSLSSLQAGRGHAADSTQVRARALRDSDLIGRLLQSEGYFDASTNVAVSPEPAVGGAFTVTLTALPGQQYRLGEIVVTGPPTRPPDLPRRALTLSRGQPIVADKVVAAEADVSVKLPEEGYPFVKLGRRDIALDPQAHTGDYALPVNPGPLSSFGHVLVSGRQVFSAKHIAEIARFKPGQLYDSRKVDDLRKALTATQLYGQLGVEPIQTDRPGPDGTTEADLRIEGSPGRSHVISASAGYDTGLGPSLSGSWTALDIWPPEGALTLSGTGGTQQQQLGATFTRSDFQTRDLSLIASIQASREHIDPYDAEGGQISFGASRQSTPLWQKIWTWSATAEAQVTTQSAYDIFAKADERKLYDIFSLPLELEYDRSDDLLNPTRGFRIKGQLTPAVSLQNGTSEYVQGVLEGDGYWPVAKPLVLAARLQFGSMLGASWYDLAPSQRFFAGGGSSVGQVRGFAYQSLGPKDPINTPLGGSAVTDFSLEARYRFLETYGVVAFLDGGQVYQTTTPQFTDLRYGAGVGFRYYTSIGPIRIDIATPLDRRPGEGVVGVYVSIGQAF